MQQKKGHLIIDEEAAAVVREVFQLYADGMGRTSIARLLNDRGIPNPTEYKRIHGLRYNGVGKAYSTLWKYFAISDMLENEMYIGNMVQGKYENRSYKSKHSKPVPKERWIRVEGTHEPIIDKELWERVQNRRKQAAKPMCTGEIGLFAEKTRCMYCGYTLRTHKSREYRYLRCTSKHFSNTSCKGAFIAQRLLEKAVLTELNNIIKEYFDEESAEARLAFEQSIDDNKRKLQKEITLLYSQIDNFDAALKNAYIDKVKGILSEQEFISFKSGFQNDIAENKKRIAVLQEQLSSIEDIKETRRTKADIISQYRNVKQLDRFMMDALIDYIEIGRFEGRKEHKDDLPPIVIHWKF